MKSWLARLFYSLDRQYIKRQLERRPKTAVGGFVVYDWDCCDVDTRRTIYANLDEALGNIRHYYPIGFSRLLRYCPRIIVELTPAYRGYFCHRRAAAVLSRKIVLGEYGGWQAALILVHEGTHAQLAAKGFDYLASRRQQIERICVKRQLAFIRCFEDAEEWIELYGSRLTAEGLSDEHLVTMYRQNIVGQLQDDGAPAALLKLIGFIHKWDMRRRFGKPPAST